MGWSPMVRPGAGPQAAPCTKPFLGVRHGQGVASSTVTCATISICSPTLCGRGQPPPRPLPLLDEPSRAGPCQPHPAPTLEWLLE